MTIKRVATSMFFSFEHGRCTFLIKEIVGGTLAIEVPRSPSLGIVHCCFLLRPHFFEAGTVVAKFESFGIQGWLPQA
jgi:hypothetical protein